MSCTVTLKDMSPEDLETSEGFLRKVRECFNQLWTLAKHIRLIAYRLYNWFEKKSSQDHRLESRQLSNKL
jgi:hypothetical protein